MCSTFVAPAALLQSPFLRHLSPSCSNERTVFYSTNQQHRSTICSHSNQSTAVRAADNSPRMSKDDPISKTLICTALTASTLVEQLAQVRYHTFVLSLKKFQSTVVKSSSSRNVCELTDFLLCSVLEPIWGQCWSRYCGNTRRSSRSR